MCGSRPATINRLPTVLVDQRVQSAVGIVLLRVRYRIAYGGNGPGCGGPSVAAMVCQPLDRKPGIIKRRCKRRSGEGGLDTIVQLHVEVIGYY